MGGESTLHFAHIEMRGQYWCIEHVASEDLRVRSGKPLRNRCGKPALRQSPDFARQPLTCEPSEQRLSRAPDLLARRRNAERELDQAMVEQRAAHLEAVRHAH